MKKILLGLALLFIFVLALDSTYVRDFQGSFHYHDTLTGADTSIVILQCYKHKLTGDYILTWYARPDTALDSTIVTCHWSLSSDLNWWWDDTLVDSSLALDSTKILGNWNPHRYQKFDIKQLVGGDTSCVIDVYLEAMTK